ncbi:MAG: hypothetical protein GDA68_07520 [Nitrospira sp. CR2.1]|nr:hypothetical protein [Nitrospira sp. CR2.1]
MNMNRHAKVRVLSCLVSLLSANYLLAGCYVDVPPAAPTEVSTRLTELLMDPNPELRSAAAESLGKIGERSASHGLLVALKDQDSRVRAAAAVSLGRLGDGASGIALVGRLLDSSEAVRAASALALTEIETTAVARAETLRMLRHQDASVRMATARALAGQDSVRFTGELVAALQDADAQVRQGVVAVLGETGDGRAIPHLVHLLRSDSYAGVRSEAAFRLGKIGNESIVRELSEAAQADADPMTRVWARWAVEQITSSRGSDSGIRPVQSAVLGFQGQSR